MADPFEGEKKHHHPSYAVVNISRQTSGGRGHNLFGSSVHHRQTVVLRVARAYRHRHLHNDWYHDEGGLPVIELRMSEAQFGQMLTSANIGGGVPCTLEFVNGKRVPEPPGEERVQEYRDELKEAGRLCSNKIAVLREQMEAILGKKGALTKDEKKSLVELVKQIEMTLSSNVPFLVEQAEEHVEQYVSDAKVEISAMLAQAQRQAGQKALMGEGPEAPEPHALPGK